MSKITDKINAINTYCEELVEIVPDTFEEYTSSNLIKAACERYFEKIVEAATDVAFIVIVQKKFRIPEDDIDAFRILFDNKMIPKEVYKKMKQAKGMRNVLAHQYGIVDDKIVFEAMTKELENDVHLFLTSLKKQNI